jgi:hypothetical protein
VIYQEKLPPTKAFAKPDGTTSYYETYLTGTGGVAFPETFHNFDVVNALCGPVYSEPCNRVSSGSPNETVFVEVYPKLFENTGIATPSFANHKDSSGQPVQDCAVVAANGGDPETTVCDDSFTKDGVTLIKPHGRDGDSYFRLNTSLDLAQHPADYRSKLVLTFAYDTISNPPTCDPGVNRILSSQEFDRLRAIAAVHELMHGLTAPHSSRCTSIMFSAPFDGQDRTVLDIFRMENNTPVPLTVSEEDKGGLKLWVP